MYWYESQEQPGNINISFPAVQAEVLRAACSERIAERTRRGNSPLGFDESIVEIVDHSNDQPSVELSFGPGSFHELPYLLNEYASRTTEVARQVNPGLSEVENKRAQLRRCDLGSTALNVFIEVEAAVVAHDSDFHRKLDVFMQSLDPES